MPGFRPTLLCGIDVSYDRETAYVVAILWNSRLHKVVGEAHSVDKVPAKYVPGFLGFREGPPLVRLAADVVPKPDAFLVDGQGYAHPRRFGLACHVGLALDRPTVGVGKSLLYGREDRGQLVDSEGKTLGHVLQTAPGRKFYVSVGYKISLETASKLVENCMVEGHPAPLRRAHIESVRLKGEHRS